MFDFGVVSICVCVWMGLLLYVISDLNCIILLIGLCYMNYGVDQDGEKDGEVWWGVDGWVGYMMIWEAWDGVIDGIIMMVALS